MQSRMEVWSFAEVGSSLVPVRVEVGLMKGLADIQMMGLPDQALKESLLRVKSAIKNQGFTLPNAHKVLVNLKPTHQKKGGRGIELAIAMAILIETGQIPIEEKDKIFAYGQLGLKGEVNFLNEVNWLPVEEDLFIWSGQPRDSIDRKLKVLRQLSDLHGECEHWEASDLEKLERPAFTSMKFTKSQAELLKILAHGGHHTMLSGPAGSGKSTLAYALHSLLPEPESDEIREIRKWNDYFDRPAGAWRPLQSPHHTATAQALLGGGNPPEPGEITRAHGGILLLDEFLEFPTRLREGMREPLERLEVRISRRGHSEILPAKFQLIATSNFCPCGDFVPKKHQPSCRFSRNKCQSYLERLSGPLADRFDILAYSQNWNEEQSYGSEEIYKHILSAQSFQKELRGQTESNGRLSWNQLLASLERPTHLTYLPEAGRSKRRHMAILRVARSLADLDEKEKIEISHIRRALDYSWRPFESLRESFL